jgi:hypothetical protein
MTGSRERALTRRGFASIISRGDPAPGRLGEARSIAMYPDFLIIGAQKSGTTWLHRNLWTHPQVWMPKREVHYFDRKIRDAGSFDDEWYASLFEPGEGKTIGEYTPSYSVIERDMVAHVHELMPEAKIIFLMRNPIERAWSHAVMRIVNNEGDVENVPEDGLIKSFDREKSQLRTNYLRTLENWGAYYPPERVFVGFLEDIHFHSEALLAEVCGFLGIDPSFRSPKMNKKINTRSSETMPTGVAVHLARTYQVSIRRLEERFGGYASFWRYCAERLVEDPPAGETITYPLWDSFLREDWTDGPVGNPEIFGHDYIQSGPLSSIQILR